MGNSPLAIIYFSKDRPLQLDLAISSNRNNCIDWEEADHYVIYKTTNEKYEKAYETVKEENPDCVFIKENVFKEDVISILVDKLFVIFIVDDAIYTDKYAIANPAQALWNNPPAIGFSFRLGNNTTACFAQNTENTMPSFGLLGDEFLHYNWATMLGVGDFGFPLEVSSTLYRSRDLLFLLYNTNWKNPNELEAVLWNNVRAFGYMPIMLCYKKSVSFCNPINKVYTENNNNRTGINISYSPEFLLEKYENGLRANPEMYSGFVSNGCHQEVEFEYITK